MSSNVDDLLYGYLPEGAEVLNSVTTIFQWATRNTVVSSFAGKNFDKTMISAFMSAKDNTERVQPITYDMKHGLTRKATATETHELRSVTQSLAWIARQTRPDFSHRISKIQSTFENAS